MSSAAADSTFYKKRNHTPRADLGIWFDAGVHAHALVTDLSRRPEWHASCEFREKIEGNSFIISLYSAVGLSLNHRALSQQPERKIVVEIIKIDHASSVKTPEKK